MTATWSRPRRRCASIAQGTGRSDDHDHDHGHIGGRGRGGSACRFRGDYSQRAVLADSAGDGWHVLLRGVRGGSDRGVRHHQQLLRRADDNGGRSSAGLGCAGTKCERTPRGRDVLANRDGAQPGRWGSAATTVRYKRSTDATITTSDTTVGTDEVNTLVPSGGYGATIKLTAPSTPGTYYYGACVDAVPRESDITNNCSTSSARLDVN